jgi:hypothetical protein
MRINPPFQYGLKGMPGENFGGGTPKFISSFGVNHAKSPRRSHKLRANYSINFANLVKAEDINRLSGLTRKRVAVVAFEFRNRVQCGLSAKSI